MTELVLASPIPQGSRGRNDWFTARWLQIHATLAEPGRTAFYPSHVEITVHSQREGKREPIVLRLSLEDALVLADTLQREVERSVPPRTSGTSGTSVKEGPDPTDRPAPDSRPRFYLCGGCDHWHREGYRGDCRENSQRFTTEQLDLRYPDLNGDGWPDWVETDWVETDDAGVSL